MKSVMTSGFYLLVAEILTNYVKPKLFRGQWIRTRTMDKMEREIGMTQWLSGKRLE